MSPNPGAAMEELPFREGQLIKVNHEPGHLIILDLVEVVIVPFHFCGRHY